MFKLKTKGLGKGWFFESMRHSLSRMGIKTGRKDEAFRGRVARFKQLGIKIKEPGPPKKIPEPTLADKVNWAKTEQELKKDTSKKIEKSTGVKVTPDEIENPPEGKIRAILAKNGIFVPLATPLNNEHYKAYKRIIRATMPLGAFTKEEADKLDLEAGEEKKALSEFEEIKEEDIKVIKAHARQSEKEKIIAEKEIKKVREEAEPKLKKVKRILFGKEEEIEKRREAGRRGILRGLEALPR